MEPKNRRQVLGSVASLLAAPLVLGKEALVNTFIPQSLKGTTEPQPPPSLNPPAHSVKRRG